MTAHDEIRSSLRAQGLRVTPQRLAIHGALSALGRHATAEEVLARVHGTVPGVSLPTVYAGLELLADLGLASRVHAGRAVRYDPRSAPHHHFVCEACGAVADLDTEVDLAPVLAGLRAGGAEPAGSELLVRGRCADCAAAGTAAADLTPPAPAPSRPTP
ncbi:MAG: Fur family transcriptional regulator [Solirubrobacteraceae bacterium]